MTEFADKIEYFKSKQAQMMALQKVATEKTSALKAEFEAKVMEAEKDLRNAYELYRAEVKAWCGITDGEKTNIIDLLEAMHKISK